MRAALVLLVLAAACASDDSDDPLRYRLGEAGSRWSDGPGEALVAELRARYPEFFEVILDPADTWEPDMRPIRGDIEHKPVDRRNFDALNAAAIAYFEFNYRAETDRGGDFYLGNSFRAAHIVAIPWRVYGETDAARLRDAILDFFEDAGSGEKLGTASTAPRLAGIVASLESKEQDPERRARIQRLSQQLRASGGGPEF
jgi:hypothetical protein